MLSRKDGTQVSGPAPESKEWKNCSDGFILKLS